MLNNNVKFIDPNDRTVKLTRFRGFDGRVSVTYSAAISKRRNKDFWEVDQSFFFYLSNSPTNRYVVVRKGFLTDGATVPKFLWSIIPPWGVYGNAAIVHDYLCVTKEVLEGEERIRVTNEEIDKIFLDAMKVSEVGWIRYPIYYGVRLWDILGQR